MDDNSAIRPLHPNTATPGCRTSSGLAVVAHLILLLITAPCAVAAENDDFTRAVELSYNLARFTEWPQTVFIDDTSPLTLCVIATAASSNVSEVPERLIHGRHIQIRTISDVHDAVRCHVAFFSKSATIRVRDVATLLRNRSILAIGEDDSFLDEGGIINVVASGDAPRFQINLTTMQNARLKISSKLLRLAEKRLGRIE